MGVNGNYEREQNGMGIPVKSQGVDRTSVEKRPSDRMKKKKKALFLLCEIQGLRALLLGLKQHAGGCREEQSSHLLSRNAEETRGLRALLGSWEVL